jgi:thiol-disulfide isomerase/thioredoxin
MTGMRMTVFSRNRRRLTGALIALPASTLWSIEALGQNMPKRGIVGRSAPELDVEFWLDADGKRTTFSMLAQRGKWVHLKCWQSWCPGCHAHGFPVLKKISDAFVDEPRVVNVGIQTTFEGHGVNTGDKVREMQLRYTLPIVMGHDPGRRNSDGYPNTMRTYRTGGTPWHVIIEPGGTVIYDGFSVNADKVIAFIRERLTRRPA